MKPIPPICFKCNAALTPEEVEAHTWNYAQVEALRLADKLVKHDVAEDHRNGLPPCTELHELRAKLQEIRDGNAGCIP